MELGIEVVDKCPQCKGLLTNPSNRLVQDNCGHKKCRLCLVNDVNSCQQCLELKPTLCNKIAEPVESHPTVITYLKKSCDVSNIKVETEVETINDENNSPVSHVKYDPKVSSYSCLLCLRSFKAKSQIQYHNYCNGSKKPFECELCKKGFIIKSHYQSHLLVHKNVKPFSCNVCQKTFFEQSKLNRHKLIHSQSRSFVCQDCGKTFKIRENLRTHSLIHKTNKPYECEQCGAKFSHASNLKKHSAVHTVTKSHMCDQCGKQFKLKWALTLHRRTHLSVRANKCTTCSKTFVQLKDLHRHELIHRESKGFTCGICDTKFKRKDNLNRHTKNAHPGKTPQIIKVVDTPNAIKVITASPAVILNNQTGLDDAIEDKKTENHINAPIKLAFKTSSFKNHYNIHRDYVEPKEDSLTTNIYEKILLPSSPSTKINANCVVDFSKQKEEESNLICQKILGPFNAPAHYETCFDNKKHAVIKNIKFKLPAKYMTQESTSADHSEIKREPYCGASSVIVNNESTANANNCNSDVHWRRRTLLNLNTKEN